MESLDFVAFDFETANYSRLSACALGVAVVRNGEIIETRKWLINPAGRFFENTHIHGITWDDVESEPYFNELWSEVRLYFEGQDIVAHNAVFDVGVLERLTTHHGLALDKYRAFCSVNMARAGKIKAQSRRLDDICIHLGFDLDHHDPVSDAVACARIVMECAERKQTSDLTKLYGWHGYRYFSDRIRMEATERRAKREEYHPITWGVKEMALEAVC